MAIAKTITLKNNFNEDSVFNNAYIKVENVDATKTAMKFTVYFYKKQNGDVLSTSQYKTNVELDGENFIKQAYLHLKTLPEFAGAKDC